MKKCLMWKIHDTRSLLDSILYSTKSDYLGVVKHLLSVVEVGRARNQDFLKYFFTWGRVLGETIFRRDEIEKGLRSVQGVVRNVICMNHRLSCPCHPHHHPDHLYELKTLLPPVMHLEAPPAGLQQVRQAVHVKHFSFFNFCSLCIKTLTQR